MINPLHVSEHDFALNLLTELPFDPNEQQTKTALALAQFCLAESADSHLPDRVFILAGYAGTGKTSLVSALVRTLKRYRIANQLLAPTGRAAKVFAAMAGSDASTIHRKIYKHALGGMGHFASQRANEYVDTVFIVDEASMIPDGKAANAGEANMMRDLIQYVYTGRGCRMIVVGDKGQLPPVGMDDSPGLEADCYRSFGLKVTSLTLTRVGRQQSQSGILAHATALRRILTGNTSATDILDINTRDYPDVHLVEGADLPDLLDSLYRRDGVHETAVICRSNRSATQYNDAIRSQVLYYEEELTPGDMLIAAKNNFMWGRNVRGMGFVANGELLVMDRVVSTEERYGVRFANVALSLADNSGVSFEAKIMLSPLHSDFVAADPAVMAAVRDGVLREACVADADIRAQISALEKSPYYNALQVKYGYAMTCHKAQGGQWLNVIIDLSYMPPDMVSAQFYRWLYTAVTRARAHVYFVSPPAVMTAKYQPI